MAESNYKAMELKIYQSSVFVTILDYLPDVEKNSYQILSSYFYNKVMPKSTFESYLSQGTRNKFFSYQLMNTNLLFTYDLAHR